MSAFSKGIDTGRCCPWRQNLNYLPTLHKIDKTQIISFELKYQQFAILTSYVTILPDNFLERWQLRVITCVAIIQIVALKLNLLLSMYLLVSSLSASGITRSTEFS